MLKLDRVKEEIGWLKLYFGTIAAIEVSLGTWLAQNLYTANRSLAMAAITLGSILGVGLALIHWRVYNRLRRLERL